MFSDKKLREEVFHPTNGILIQAQNYANGVLAGAKQFAAGEAQRLYAQARQYVDTSIKGLDARVQELAGDVERAETVVNEFRSGIVNEAGQYAQTAVDKAVGTYFSTHGLTVTDGKEVDLDDLLTKTQTALHDPLREKVLRTCKDKGLRVGDPWNYELNAQETKELEGLTLGLTSFDPQSTYVSQNAYTSEKLLTDFTRYERLKLDPSNEYGGSSRLIVTLLAPNIGAYCGDRSSGNPSLQLDLSSNGYHAFMREQTEDQLQQLGWDMIGALFVGVASRYIQDSIQSKRSPQAFLPGVGAAINKLRTGELQDNAILDGFATELVGQYGVMAQYLKPIEKAAVPTL